MSLHQGYDDARANKAVKSKNVCISRWFYPNVGVIEAPLTVIQFVTECTTQKADFNGKRIGSGNRTQDFSSLGNFANHLTAATPIVPPSFFRAACCTGRPSSCCSSGPWQCWATLSPPRGTGSAGWSSTWWTRSSTTTTPSSTPSSATCTEL